MERARQGQESGDSYPTELREVIVLQTFRINCQERSIDRKCSLLFFFKHAHIKH